MKASAGRDGSGEAPERKNSRGWKAASAFACGPGVPTVYLAISLCVFVEPCPSARHCRTCWHTVSSFGSPRTPRAGKLPFYRGRHWGCNVPLHPGAHSAQAQVASSCCPTLVCWAPAFLPATWLCSCLWGHGVSVARRGLALTTGFTTRHQAKPHAHPSFPWCPGQLGNSIGILLHLCRLPAVCRTGPGPQTAAGGPWDTLPHLFSSVSSSASSLCIPSELLVHPFMQQAFY